MKRVLLITENLGSGGAERQLCGLAVLLQTKGYIVKFVSYVENQFYESLLQDNCIDYELRTDLCDKKNRIFLLIKLYKEFKPDVIISYLPAVNKSICLSRIFYRCKVIVSERSHTMDWNLKTRIQFCLYSLADRIVTNSSSEALNIKLHCPFLTSKISTISNFVDSNKFCPKLDKEKNSILNILCLGRVIPSKNILRLLDAVNIIVRKQKLFHITWVGSQYDRPHLLEVLTKIEELNLQRYVTLKGQVNNPLVEYQNADIFCLPTLYEGFPNVICEAMACGLPILCSNVCDNAQIVDDGVNGFLFDPLDANDIAEKFLKIFACSDQRLYNMKIKSREIALEKFSTECFVNNYINIIES